MSRDIPLLRLRQHISIKNVNIIKEVTVVNDIIKAIEDEQLRSDITEFRVGDTIKVYAKVIEGSRERIQTYEKRTLTGYLHILIYNGRPDNGSGGNGFGWK